MDLPARNIPHWPMPAAASEHRRLVEPTHQSPHLLCEPLRAAAHGPGPRAAMDGQRCAKSVGRFQHLGSVPVRIVWPDGAGDAEDSRAAWTERRAYGD